MGSSRRIPILEPVQSELIPARSVATLPERTPQRKNCGVLFITPDPVRGNQSRMIQRRAVAQSLDPTVTILPVDRLLAGR
jgi:hypothetical protein